MHAISKDKITSKQIKLLQSSGKTLTTLHNSVMTLSYDMQVCESTQKISPKLSRMNIPQLICVSRSINNNLLTFSYVLVKLISGTKNNQEILILVKSFLYCDQFDMKVIKGVSGVLSNVTNLEMKKILAEFLIVTQKIQIHLLLKDYPLVLEIITLFLRTVLHHFQLQSANNYQRNVSTNLAFQILFQFFDILYHKHGNLYLFTQDNLFIQNGYRNQKKQLTDDFFCGTYFESGNQILSKQIKQNNLKNKKVMLDSSKKFLNQGQAMQQKNVLYKPKNLNFLIQSRYSTNNKSMIESNILKETKHPQNSNYNQANHMQDSQNHPTPFFNQIIQEQYRYYSEQNTDCLNENNKKQTYKGKININVFNMKQSATLNVIRSKNLKSSIMEPLRFLNHHQQGLQTTDSPITTLNDLFFNTKQNQIIMKRSHSQKSSLIKNNQRTSFQAKSNISLFGMGDKKLKKSIQMDQFYFDSNLIQKINKIHQKSLCLQGSQQICPHSTFTCTCSAIKVKKNKLDSKTVNFIYKPQNLTFKPQNLKKKQNVKLQNKNIFTKKIKLNDEFFKKIKAKKIKEQQTQSKNKSENKSYQKDKVNSHERTFIKYSQIVRMNQQSKSKSKKSENQKSQIKLLNTKQPIYMNKTQSFFRKNKDKLIIDARVQKMQIQNSKKNNISTKIQQITPKIFAQKAQFPGVKIVNRPKITISYQSSQKASSGQCSPNPFINSCIPSFSTPFNYQSLPYLSKVQQKIWSPKYNEFAKDNNEFLKNNNGFWEKFC